MRITLLFPLIITISALLNAGCSNDLSPQTPGSEPVSSTSGVIVETLEIQSYDASINRVEVLIKGNLDDRCTVLEQPVVQRDGDVFRITFPTTHQEASNCTPSMVPFEHKLSLDVQDIPAGTYIVAVGNQQTPFDLPQSDPTGPATLEATDGLAAEQTPSETATEISDPQKSEPALTMSGTDLGHISGFVWHDQCQTDGNTNSDSATPPPGCVLLNNGYSANGILESDELGISGVMVELGTGTCPASNVKVQTADNDGTFVFNELPLGIYCVSINPQNPHNVNILQSGNWTSPETAVGNATITLDSDMVSTQVYFAWEFAHQAVLENADCREKAAFFEDVTVPDNTVFRPGESFVKTWRLRNEGTCSWGPEYDLIFSHGDQLDGPSSTPLPSVAPGEIINLSVDLQAPELGGTYVGNWQLRNPDGIPFGVGINGKDFFWVQIAVSWFPAPDQPPVSSPISNPSPTPTSTLCEVSYDTGYENEVLSLINAARENQGLTPLAQQDQLSAAARGHSADMACNDFVDHTGSNGSTWFDRASAQGYVYTYASENIYVGDPAFGGTPQGAFDWWMNSQVHRDNILYPGVSEVGIGYVYRPESTFGGYYTLVFANP